MITLRRATPWVDPLPSGVALFLAVPTEWRRGVRQQPIQADLHTAVATQAIHGPVDAVQGRLNAAPVRCKSLHGCLGHRLLLHGIHARQATYACLVERHRGRVLHSVPLLVPQPIELFKKDTAKALSRFRVRHGGLDSSK
ncbi:MAG TPA: hypothetical protein VMN83_05095 [Albitalea sp.]|nr:hypothetical protein [Albitalea sp.]HUG21889.1 hypothetical protein [Albitalea sp.]